MSSRQVTVERFIEMLNAYPSDMLVAIPQLALPGEYYEGMFDGPSVHDLKVVKMQDVRSGFNPTELTGEHDFDVLVIQ